MTLTKNDLAKELHTNADLPLELAERCVEMLIKKMARALAEGSKIEIRGFGALTVKQIGARTGRNPRTGEAVPVPPTKSVKFKAFKPLKDAVNGNHCATGADSAQ